tara:strand:+ start:633 stop:821 length:189 start_codon:yes stop_codon:yes gene_type:complete
MTKRKYVRSGEEPVAFECTKQKCKWQGKEEQKGKKKDGDWTVFVCPKCGNPDFYGLLEAPTP